MAWGKVNVSTAGNAALNYSVFAYADVGSLPVSADENTLAIISSSEVNLAYFQPDEPLTPETGDVWFVTAFSSLREFNALKEGALMVNPTAVAKQYNGASWDDVNAYIYQTGWQTLEFIVYSNGDIYAVTGGWTNSIDYGSYLKVSAPTSTTVYGSSVNAIDFTAISTLKVYADISSGVYRRVYFSTSQSTSGSVGYFTINAGENTLDVSTITGLKYILIYAMQNTAIGTSTLQVSRIEEIL